MVFFHYDKETECVGLKYSPFDPRIGKHVADDLDLQFKAQGAKILKFNKEVTTYLHSDNEDAYTGPVKDFLTI